MTSPTLTAYQQAYFDDCSRLGIAPGTCFCGCLGATFTTERDIHGRGMRKGDHFRFIAGHQHRKSPIEYLEEERGYTTPCWIWQQGISTCNGKKYGLAKRAGTRRSTQAHRMMYERLRGPIPEHFDLHHLCDVPLCVNPDHLQPLSHGEHMRIGRQSKLSHEKAQKIKNLHAEGYSQRNLAEMFGVHSSQISRICSGKKWNPANDHTIRVSKPITEDEIIHPKIRQEHLICPQCGGHRAGRAYPVCRSCRSKAMRDKRPSDSQIYTVDGFACRKIVSSKYQWALLDTSRYDEISSEMWQAVWSDHSQKFYIGCARKNSATGKQQYYSMASIILRVPRGTSIGYVNGNTLDLRECNLYVKEKVLRSGGTRRNR